MWLLLAAVVGLLGPGGLFLYWVHSQYTTLAAALSDWMAVAYFLDLVMSTLLFGYLFAARPIGPIKWYWFVAMSFLGTLAFAIPMFVWLNWRAAADPRPSFADWWRTA